jgi:hypothetical protein
MWVLVLLTLVGRWLVLLACLGWLAASYAWLPAEL